MLHSTWHLRQQQGHLASKVGAVQLRLLVEASKSYSQHLRLLKVTLTRLSKSKTTASQLGTLRMKFSD